MAAYKGLLGIGTVQRWKCVCLGRKKSESGVYQLFAFSVLCQSGGIAQSVLPSPWFRYTGNRTSAASHLEKVSLEGVSVSNEIGEEEELTIFPRCWVFSVEIYIFVD